MREALSTPPAIPAGALGAGPQPRLSVAGGLVLRGWERSDAAVLLGAYEQYRRAWAQETGASWAVTRGGGEVLGRIALGRMNLDDGVAGCAYWVLPAARGAGVASRRVALKSGFLLEGTKRSDAVHSDGRHDMHLHAASEATNHSPDAGLLALGGGADGDLADLHVGGLLDGEGDGARDGFRWDGQFGRGAADLVADLGVVDGVGEFGADEAR